MISIFLLTHEIQVCFENIVGSFAKELVMVIFNLFNVPVLQKEFIELIMSKQFDLSMRKIGK